MSATSAIDRAASQGALPAVIDALRQLNNGQSSGGGGTPVAIFGDGSDGPKTYTAAGNATPANVLPPYANFTTLVIEAGAIVTFPFEAFFNAPVIRASVSVVIEGKIDGADFLPSGALEFDGINTTRAGVSVGGSGGGGGGAGGTSTTPSWAEAYHPEGGDGHKSTGAGVFPLSAAPPSTGIGLGGAPGGIGANGADGTDAVGAYADVNEQLARGSAETYPAGLMAIPLNAMPGARGGDGGVGGTSILNGTAGPGNGGQGGAAGASLWLLSPVITRTMTSELDLHGGNGTNGTDGQDGLSPANAGAGGSGGGGGGGGGNGGNGGIFAGFAKSFVGTFGTVNVGAGGGGGAGNGGAAGLGNTGGGNGGKGGNGSAGVGGAAGMVIDTVLV